METIKCKDCGRELEESNYHVGRWGRLNVCCECMDKRRAANKENKKREQQEKINEMRSMHLKDYSPRELMEELARRGYRGKLTYTKIEEIDITNF